MTSVKWMFQDHMITQDACLECNPDMRRSMRCDTVVMMCLLYTLKKVNQVAINMLFTTTVNYICLFFKKTGLEYHLSWC